MTYPDGTQVNVGDHIWWNEGSSIGFVQTIVEGRDTEAEWGFSEPNILISGYHPRMPDDAGYVACPPSDFADEGIGRLTSSEEELLDYSVSEVRNQPGYQEPFLIGTICRDGQAQAFTFSTFDGEKTEEFGRVTLPARNAQNQTGGGNGGQPFRSVSHDET